MDPKRFRFSDLSSDSDSSSRSSTHSSRSGAASADFVLHLSASFSPDSTSPVPPTEKDRACSDDFEFVLPVDPPRPSHATDPLSRESIVTVVSGTTVWTAHGSARTTMGVGMPTSATGTIESTENTERIDQDTIKLRRRTVGAVSSNNNCDPERSITPTANMSNSSPTIIIQRRAISIADDTEELPPTQPSGPLKGVVAYVEVLSGADNRSATIGNALRDLGATVCKRLLNKVTHVVFRDGRQATIERARSRNIFLVSVLWVEACQRENDRLPESEYCITRQEKRTPWNLRGRRFRSMQPRAMEAELALTDDCVRKRKQRLDASKQKREVRKDIRDGRIVGMSSANADLENESLLATPVLDVPARPQLSNLNTGGWNLDNNDETPESLRRQVADVRKKILGDTPDSGRRDSSLVRDETLAGSVRKKLFGTGTMEVAYLDFYSGGMLHGTPLPSLLDRPKRITRSACSGASEDRLAMPNKSAPTANQQSHRHRELNSFNGSLLQPHGANANADGTNGNTSKIDRIVDAVCEKVRTMDLVNHNQLQSARRRIFDRQSERISDGITHTPDTSGQGGPSNLLSLTARVAAKNASLELDDIFGSPSAAVRGTTTKGKGKRDPEIVRLRSSLFEVKSSSAIVRQLQMGRRSSEEFESLLTAIGKSSRVKRAAKANTVSTLINRKWKPKRRRAVRCMVLTNVKQEDRELICAIAKRMKGFRIQNKVTADTTHVICGENRRTLSVLMGVARGCWMLPLSWVYHSLAEGEWLSEERFELAEQFPAAKVIRKGTKVGLGDVDYSATCRLFSTVGPFYISPASQPPCIDLCSLIRWCGGKIALTSKRASFCVGFPSPHNDAVGVKETWILDSIMQYGLIPIDDYLIR